MLADETICPDMRSGGLGCLGGLRMFCKNHYEKSRGNCIEIYREIARCWQTFNTLALSLILPFMPNVGPLSGSRILHIARM